jgi:hypothetical protein
MGRSALGSTGRAQVPGSVRAVLAAMHGVLVQDHRRGEPAGQQPNALFRGRHSNIHRLG